jgi:predicted ArsR family transcriptional regulator
MEQCDDDLSCTAKLARVVLANRGPLSPSEVASEARISAEEAREGLAELAAEGLAESVCGVAATREEVYQLTKASPEERSV